MDLPFHNRLAFTGEMPALFAQTRAPALRTALHSTAKTRCAARTTRMQRAHTRNVARLQESEKRCRQQMSKTKLRWLTDSSIISASKAPEVQACSTALNSAISQGRALRAVAAVVDLSAPVRASPTRVVGANIDYAPKRWA